MSAEGLSPMQLIALVLDGRPDAAAVERLVRLASLDPEIRRQLRQHLIISEVASQVTAPERSADAFIAGLAQRRRAQADGLAFTARVLTAANAERTQRVRAAGRFALEVAGLSAAATLLIGLLLTLAHVATAYETRAASGQSTASVPRPIDASAMLRREQRGLE